ncbi:ABC transporter ATP-binding protein [Streptococcus hillyeri]|uniref:ABC transporter ATP-binding protein n=1 Tax=Streptococcus hillyeri TaxID=2282420 RepID=A0A3L9DVP3_9STRE|nr:ABC transporter ATP-binding protein [Streptococcus hillyeri]RLY03222.1 ABC transporter ATP-binding protein [Streptococcus hillyeri]
MEMISCQQLKKVYGEGENQVIALNNVTLSVEKGEFIAVLGPSGSGKSTLLHMLAGVDKPDSGKVFIAGTDLSQLNQDKLAIFRRRHVGLVYQFFNLMPVLTAEENITLPHLLDGRKLDKARLDEVLHYLGLENRRSHLPSELSGGQQQRVSIGRALYSRPDILLCDEPTGNLDRKATQDIMLLLKEANRTLKQTVMMITHDESLALQADRLIYIEDGKIMRDERIRHQMRNQKEK